MPSGCGIYRVYLIRKHYDELNSNSPSTVVIQGQQPMIMFDENRTRDIGDDDDAISAFDLTMDDLGQCRFVNVNNQTMIQLDASQQQQQQQQAEEYDLKELVMYIQKNSRLKLVLLASSDDVNQELLQLVYIFKIVSR